MSNNPIALRRDGAVAGATKLPAYVKTAFVAPLEAVFRKVNDAPDAAALATRIYGEQLAKFDESVVARAAEWFIRHRKDPFYPTVAECLEVCQQIERRDAVERDQAEFQAALAKERTEKEQRKAAKAAADKAEREAAEAEWERNRLAAEKPLSPGWIVMPL